MALPTDYRTIDEGVAVSGQITVEQVAEIAAAGYKSLICNRPDSEIGPESAFTAIEAAAKDAGLAVRYIPVAGTGMTIDDVEATRAALSELERPIYAYCRSGARSTNVYTMANR